MKKFLFTIVLTSMLLGLQAQFLKNGSINGYSSFEVEMHVAGDHRGDDFASFDADLFDLVFNYQATPKLRVAADLTWEHGTATEENWGNAAVEYAFSEYTINELLKFRVGKMFTAFGIYNEVHTAKPAFISTKEPLSTNKNHKFGSDVRFYPRWGNGLSVLGKTKLGKLNADYIIQLTNGYQENTNPYEEDDNIQKAIGTRFRLSKRNKLKIGLSGYVDYISNFDSVGNDIGLDMLQSYGAFLIAKRKNLSVEVEYVYGNITPLIGSQIERNAYTAMLSYEIKKVTPYVRVEFLDPNMSFGGNTAAMYSPGINIEIDKGYIFKIQYNFIESGDLNRDLGGDSYQEIQTAIVVGF